MDDDGPQAHEEIVLEHPDPQPEGSNWPPPASEYNQLQSREDLSQAAKEVYDNLPTKDEGQQICLLLHQWLGCCFVRRRRPLAAESEDQLEPGEESFLGLG